MNKIIVLISVTLFIISCSETEKKKPIFTPTPVASVDGSKVFKISCAVCHGEDGKLGANGSKDLTKSVMTLEDRIAIITNGKGLMPAQGAILSTEEIKAAAAHTLSLK
jgi:mono/diheme cytochrome c family protein